LIAGLLGFLLCCEADLFAQSVCLPAPRLLTTTPMGGRVGTQVEISVSGEHLDGIADLLFSDPHLTAAKKLDAAGNPEPNKYVVSIAADCPPGIYEARVLTRLGLSSSRIFSVGTFPEVTQKPNTTLATALELQVNSICNSVVTPRAIDYYSFEARQGMRIIVDCAARGIDSKLDPVLVIADAEGRDLLVERRAGILDFKVPADGRYIIKVHELTFKGGNTCFYRLVLRELAPDARIARHPATRSVNSFSWPPKGLPESPSASEAEPNNEVSKPQSIALPCDIAGSFLPAADVDVFEFDAKKGEEWWIEVASERFGLPTDPSLLVQRVTHEGDFEKLIDVVELSDIPSPVKVSSNGYAYDGPPYNAGSSDPLGKLSIPEDGRYRLQLRDLFGGTRNDPRNVYRLVIRQAQPDFALVAWPLHMELRNGDRNALSKPISLRGGSTMALEVVAVRRDGFDGDIELSMENLPAGVTAHGVKIPAGKVRGLMLVSAASDAPQAFTSAKFVGRAKIGDTEVERPCRLATMAWPIPDSWGEIPFPRLMADVPVSVSGVDQAPLTISPAQKEIYEVAANEKLTIPLVNTRRSEFSGATMQLRTMGCGFEGHPTFELPLTSDNTQTVIDLAALNPAPGDYVIAFYGGAVAKYRHHLDQVAIAEEAERKAKEELASLDTEIQQLTAQAESSTVETKEAADKAVADATARRTAASAALAAASERLKNAISVAQPNDIVDIVVSEPIAIRVKPAESK